MSPRFESEVDRLLDLLAPHVGDRLAMLVVPNHWGDAPIVPGSPFATRLRAWAERGIEMFLHGFTHRDEAQHSGAADRVRARFMTAGEGEFLGLVERGGGGAHRRRPSADRRRDRPPDRRLRRARVAVRRRARARRSRQSGIPLAEDHLRVWSPATGAELAWGPVITWASRTRMRLASSLAAAAALRHAPLEVLRIGVHPPDVRHPALVAKHRRDVPRRRDGTARPARYGDLLS